MSQTQMTEIAWSAERDRERLGHGDICDYTYVRDHQWSRKRSLEV